MRHWERYCTRILFLVGGIHERSSKTKRLTEILRKKILGDIFLEICKKSNYFFEIEIYERLREFLGCGRDI